jgi:aldehyde:ferredoxin oxidoreductase
MDIFRHGYAGSQLRVNLNHKKFISEKIQEEWTKKYFGGTGYATILLYTELKPGIDPLSPENKIVIASGPLTMNKVPGGGSLSVCFKSPLTGCWGESRVGSDFGPEMRRAGYDHIILEGRAANPVILVITDGKAEIVPAGNLIGKTVSEKRRILIKEHALSGYQLLTIGPGGENLVRFANIMVGDRAAGRGGGGAVMGSKNLLCIAIKGSKSISEAEPDKFKTAIQDTIKVLKKNPNHAGLQAAGTIGELPGNDEDGDWPTKNWQSNSWGKGTEIYDHYEKHNFLKPYGCYRGCSIRCGRKVHVASGEYKTPEHGGAEYESITCFTAYVLNKNVDAAVYSTWLCNDMGLDTISAGAMIAFAMECYEKGLISKEDADGLDLSWGNAAVLPQLVEMMARRKGIGDLLSEGVKRAAERLGEEAEAFAVHVKGMEGPAHDPRSGKALAITYGTSNRGMCHIHPVEAMAWDRGKMDFGLMRYGLDDPNSVEKWDERGKGEAVKILQDGLILPDILGICKFFMYAGLTLDHIAAMLSALTGKTIDGKELLRVGERVTNLQRLFNFREGLTKDNDMIPARIMALPVLGKYQTKPGCVIEDYQGMLADYYEARDWDTDTGTPSRTKLRELGIL